MKTNRPFLKRILLLGAVPTVCTTLLLVFGFYRLHSEQIEDSKTQILQLVENTYAEQPQDLDASALVTQLRPLLYIEALNNLTIIDASNNILAQLGRPLKRTELKTFSLDPSKATTTETQHQLFLSLPLEGQLQGAWLVTEISKLDLIESVYQGIIIIILVAAVCLAIVMYSGLQLNAAIVQPLNDIIAQLRTTLKSTQNSEIQAANNTPYLDLIDTINELLSLQHSAQDEMQHNVEQSTRELRETLETVEIQNIELDIARKNALQASRAKSEFLANTGHEVRTPLNGILGFTSLLLKTSLTEQQKDYLTTIEQSAQGLLTVINDILDFSKLETGQLTLEYKPILVRELIEEIFGVFAPQAHEKNIHLMSMVSHNVPRNLLGDPQRLKQVLTNIISNSIKFSARGNVIVHCSAVGELDTQIEIKFAITDNGIGLTEEQQENLFKAFTKVDSSDSRLQGGTGLGLAIAKGLVDRMHGEIGVASEIRSGSTFWFTVKLGVDKQRISQSPLTDSLYGVRALVFDANQSGRREITHLLDNWGIEFVEEASFRNLPAVIANNRLSEIDLLILDTFTDANNFDREALLEQVRALNNQCHCPMILLAPPAIQRSIQQDIIGLNAIIVQRPLAHNALHQSICSLLSIAEPEAHDARERPALAKANESAIKVLVVDDNPANRKLVCEFLKPLNTATSDVESGYKALELLKTQSFDLILMDVQMPEMDGLETTRTIRRQETNSRTPIVALTAHAVADQKTKILLAGMDDFMSKPVSEEDLVRVIDRWVIGHNIHAVANSESAKPELKVITEKAQKSSVQVPASGSDNRVFSWSESLELAKDNQELAYDMVKMLADSLDETASELATQLEAENFKQLYEVNHKFYGGCCYCGVPALREASKALEIALRGDQVNNIEQLTQNVLHEISRLKSWADEHDLEALFVE